MLSFVWSCSLGKALDMNLHFTSGYHPKGDGQTEWTNQTLEQYLRIFCNYQQDNWYTLLPLVEFAYNNAPSATTGISPFIANKGYHPNLTIHLEHNLTSSHAKDLVVNLDELHQELKTTISEAQHRYQGHANARQMPATRPSCLTTSIHQSKVLLHDPAIQKAF